MKNKKIVLGGGCFWCTEAVFRNLKGVLLVRPGYAGGMTENPTYEQVSSGTTGHAEVIEVEYDSNEVALSDLLTVFFVMHDSTTPNQQGQDVGPQYRSAIFCTTEAQKRETEEFIDVLQREIPEKIVTEVTMLSKFYPAENYHHDYYQKNQSAPYCRVVIDPKLRKLQENFKKLLV